MRQCKNYYYSIFDRNKHYITELPDNLKKFVNTKLDESSVNEFYDAFRNKITNSMPLGYKIELWEYKNFSINAWIKTKNNKYVFLYVCNLDTPYNEWLYSINLKPMANHCTELSKEVLFADIFTIRIALDWMEVVYNT